MLYSRFSLAVCFIHSSNSIWASRVAQWVKNPPAKAGYTRDMGSIPELRRSAGGGHGNPCQYSCLENPMDRGSWRATVHEVAKSWTQLSNREDMHMNSFRRHVLSFTGASLVAQPVKKSACSVGDLGLISGLGRSPGEGHSNPLPYLAWRIPWTEEPGGLQSMRSQRVGHD